MPKPDLGMQPTYPQVQAHGPSIQLAEPPATHPERPLRPGFVIGLKLLFRGLGQLISSPSLYWLAAVPMAIVIGLTGILGFFASKWLPPFIERVTGSNAWWAVIVETVAMILAVVLAFVVSLLVAQPLSAPALERLVRKVEQAQGVPPQPPTPFLLDMARGLGSALLGLAVGAPILVGLSLLNLIPGASIIVVPLKFLVTLVLIGWDVCDYPLAVRGVALSDRLAFMSRHIRAIVGFTFGIGLIGTIPCGALLILPAGVVGATHLVLWALAYDRAITGESRRADTSTRSSQ